MLPRRIEATLVCFLSNAVMFEGPGVVDRLRRWAVRKTARRAANVLVPSAAMASLVEPAIGRRPEVVPRGIDHRRFAPGEDAGTEVLCVADFYPHKRHELLLEAWASLRDPRPPLRFIGDPRVNPAHFSQLTEAASRLQDLGQIFVQPRLPQAALAAAYRRARVFALPSLHESFCMPLAEAQACGVPSVVRDIPALRETGGGGAVYVDSDTPEAWANALVPFLDEDGRYREARDAAIANARRFSWDHATAEIKERLLDGT